MRFLTLSFLALLALPVYGRAQTNGIRHPTSFAFTHVTVIDMTGSPPKPDMTAVVTGNRIALLGPSRIIRVPRGTLTLDATGKFLIPGLWDMHVHAAWPATLPTFGPLFLANGVTGVREMWGAFDLVASARIRLAQHSLTEPRFVASGALLDGSPPIWEGSVVITTAEAGRRAVDSLHAMGADFIKVYNLLSPEAYAAIVKEAKRLHMPVAGHVPIAVGALAVSQAGQRSIEHLTDILLSCSSHETVLRAALVSRFNQPYDSVSAQARRQLPELIATYNPAKCQALAAQFRRDSTWQVPTLTVLRSSAHLDDSVLASDPRLEYVSREVRELWDPRKDFRFKAMTASDFVRARQLFAKQVELVGLLHRAGVPILAGTDVLNPYCFPGFSLHDELAMLVDAGLTPMEALQAATRNPAIFLRATDSLGTVETGKLADLVLLDADPIADIHNTTKINTVVLDGQFLDPAARQRLLDFVRVEAALQPPDSVRH
jgi:imidazolonepropionase-like amidohydrolase